MTDAKKQERDNRRRETEAELVGYLLRDARECCEHLDAALAELKGGDFADARTGAAFEAIRSVRAQGGFVVERSVAEASKGAVSAEELTEALKRADGLASMSIPELVKRVKAEAERDARERVLRTALERNERGDDDGESVLSVLGSFPEHCGCVSGEADDAAALFRELAADARAMNAGTFVDAKRVPLGVPRVDDMLDGGISAGEMLVLAARPACGKTALAVHVVAAALSAGRKVLFASLEMTRKDICSRIVSNLAECPFPRNVERWKKAEKIFERGGGNGLERLFDERQELARRLRFLGNMPRSKFFAKIRAMFRRESFDLLVVDYLQLIAGDAGEADAYARATLNSQQMKMLANDLGVPVLALAQLNRAPANADRPPRASDMRDSGALEQDADFVLLLSEATGQTEEERERESPRDKTRRLDFVKNRRGSTGTMKLSFDFMTFRVREEGAS